MVGAAVAGPSGLGGGHACRRLPAAAAGRGMLSLLATWALLAQRRGAEALSLRRGGGEHVVSPSVRKPLTDQRSYEHVTFSANGLRVLAVQDPRAAKAGFAVSVEAGSFYDPTEFPGLAHFCEHLLFLGTEKYPDEASFDQFMALHDGSNNAYTEQERTVFYNEVGHTGFDEGLDRFAQFFIAPLFKQDMVGRELNAVNSEHEKNRPDQGRRLWEVLRRTAREDSVLSHFYTGTTESLHHGDASAVAALRKYHDENYCAPRMHLVMISNLSTAEQLRLAHRHFDAVPRGRCGARKDFGPGPGASAPTAFDSAHLGQFIRMGTNSTPALWMMFPLLPTEANYREAPLQYLQYMLGYAGPKSLRSRLKRQGLVTNIAIQADESSAATLLFLTYDLTPLGAQEAGVREITQTTHSYLQLLAEERHQEVPAVYESLQRMSKVTFDYSEAPDSVMDAVSELAAAMDRFPSTDILTGSNGLIDNLDPAPARRLLRALAAPNASSAALAVPEPAAPTPASLSEASTALVGARRAADAAGARFEKYYGIHYQQGPLPLDWQAPKDGDSELRVPPPLNYVPSDLAVRNATAGPYPVLVEVPASTNGTEHTSESLELWWKGQGAFQLPKAQLRLKLTLPSGAESDASKEAARRLHAELARQVLEEATEDLQSCGLDFQLRASGTGYGFQLDGYDQHLGVLLQEVVAGFLAPEFGPPELERARRQVTDDLADTTRQAPYELAAEALAALTTDDAFSREDILAELGKVDEAGLRRYLADLRQGGLRAQLLVLGNVEQLSATHLAEKVASTLLAGGQGRLLSAPEARKPHVLVASRPVEVRMRNPIPGDANHATLNVYQYGVPDVSERVKMLLLGKMIANPVYDTLRTQKQLGYVVFGFMSEQEGVLELRVVVQGTKEMPDEVDADIEGVVDRFEKDLRQMDGAQFAKWKASIRSALHHKDQNMGQEADRFWSQIVNDGHCFNRKEMALQYLETMNSAEDVWEAFHQLREGHRKVSIKMFGATAADAALVLASTATSPASASGAATGLLRLSGAGFAEKQRLLSAGGGPTYYPTAPICQISTK